MSETKLLYGCFDLTEDEHFIVEDMLQKKCDEIGAKLIYYRKLKDGHVPCIREFKISGEKWMLYQMINFMQDEKLDESKTVNPHTTTYQGIKTVVCENCEKVGCPECMGTGIVEAPLIHKDTFNANMDMFTSNS
jgi:hypothetical protein